MGCFDVEFYELFMYVGNFFFYDQFLRAVLGSWQMNLRLSRKCSVYPQACTLHPWLTVLHENDTFITTDKSLVTHHDHSKVHSLHLGLTPGIVHTVGVFSALFCDPQGKLGIGNGEEEMIEVEVTKKEGSS